MPEENVTTAANTESVAASQSSETTQTTPAESSAVQQTQDVTQTQAFSHRLKEATTQAEQQARDAVIAELYGESHGIKTYADYQAAIQRQQQAAEAQQRGMDPQFYSEFQSMQQKLNTYERNSTLAQQDAALSADSNLGNFYTQHKAEIQQIANQYNTDYDTALTLLLRDKLPTLMSGAVSQAEQSTIQKLTNNAQSTPGALGAEGAEHKTGYSQLSATEKKALREKVLRGETTDF